MVIYQVPVVQKLNNAIHQINHYPVDSEVCFVNTYLLDSVIWPLNNWDLVDSDIHPYEQHWLHQQTLLACFLYPFVFRKHYKKVHKYDFFSICHMTTILECKVNYAKNILSCTHLIRAAVICITFPKTIRKSIKAPQSFGSQLSR